MRTELRRATLDDAASLAELAAEVGLASFTRASIAEEISRAHAEVLAASDGFVIAWHVADETTILAIAVRKNAQRRGIGSALFDAIDASARARGSTTLHLEVRASNLAARAFYRARGLEEIGVRRGYYDDGGEDAVLMRRSLT